MEAKSGSAKLDPVKLDSVKQSTQMEDYLHALKEANGRYNNIQVILRELLVKLEGPTLEKDPESIGIRSPDSGLMLKVQDEVNELHRTADELALHVTRLTEII